jgi:sugar lactone lactonase YvrE
MAIAALVPEARPSSAAAASTPTLAQVRYIDHGLTVQRPHQRQQQGTLKMPLFPQYGLQTKARQHASIRFRDQTTLHMNQLTSLVLRSPHVTQVQKGEVDELLTPGTDHRVQTSAAVASAIGTDFDIRVKGFKTTVIVVHGAVLVKNARGSVVVKTGQEVTVAPNKKPSKPQPVDAGTATSWAANIPAPSLGENLALDANGGRVTAASSAQPKAPPGNAIDGRLDTAWESTGSGPGSLTVGFEGTKLFLVSGVLLDGAASGSTSPQTDLKDFSIRYSTTGTDDRDFGTLFRGTLKHSATRQWVPLVRPIAIRYLQLVTASNYGSSAGTSVAELEVVGVANTSHIFDFPSGIALDAQGNVEVADSGLGVVQRLSPEGKLLATLGTPGNVPGRIDRPNGIAVDKSGNTYVAEGPERVIKLAPDGSVLTEWGTPGSGPGQFSAPEGVATDSQGNVYVADTNNQRIQKFSPSGQFITQFGGRGRGPGQFSYGPCGIAIDPSGNLYISESATQLIWKLSPSGQQVARWGGGGKGPGQFANPTGIALDRQGNVYVADSENTRIQKFTANGQYITSWTTPGPPGSSAPIRPLFLAVDAQGNVYASGGQVVDKFSPDGKLVASWR